MAKPSAEHLLAIHQRLLADDPVAPAELAEVAIEPLVEELRLGRRRLRDESMVYEAVVDAVLELTKLPHRYDRAKSSMWSYLKMSARGNLANLLLKEHRQRNRVFRSATVALHDPARKKMEEDVLTLVAEAEMTGLLQDKLAKEIASLSPGDAAVFRLMSDGVRDTAQYANALGIGDKPPEEQRRIVKQAKDRLMKRLKRSLQGESNE